jgi:hypothetical protein
MTFGDRREYPQLRAADLLVYEAARMGRRFLKEANPQLRTSMKVLAERRNLLLTFPTEKQMHNFVRILDTAVEAMNRGASNEELERITQELREKLELSN